MKKLKLIALIGTITTFSALGQNINVQYNTNINTGISNPYNTYPAYQVYNPYNVYSNPYNTPNAYYNVNVSNDPLVCLVRSILKKKRRSKRRNRRNRNCR